MNSGRADRLFVSLGLALGDASRVLPRNRLPVRTPSSCLTEVVHIIVSMLPPSRSLIVSLDLSSLV